jgi:hypothetical protein
MRRLLLGLVALVAFAGDAQAQSCSGTPNANQVCAGPSSGGAGFPSFRAEVNADLPTSPANSVKGSIAGGAPADLTTTQLTTLCNLFTATLSGCAPAFPNNTTTFLRGDGTWTGITAGSLPAFTGDTTASAGSTVTTTGKVNGVTYPAAPSTGTVPLVTGASAVTYTIPSGVLDVIGSTRGSVLERGATGWQIVTPGTSGLPWVSNGTGADPGYQTLTNSGIAAGTVLNSNLANMAANTVKGSIAGGTPADLNAPFITGGTQGQVLTKNSSTAGDASWRDQCLNIEAFGGVGNNSANTVTPLTNALAALSGTGGCIFFPPGKYTFATSLSYNMPAGIFSVNLRGGGYDNTILTWPNASGGITFNYAGINSSVHLEDVSFTTGVANGGNGVTLNLSTSIVNPAVTATSSIYRVTFRGDDGYALTDYWTTAVNIANVNNVQMSDLTVFGSSTLLGQGVALVGLPGSSTFGVEYNISLSNFNNLATGINYGNFVQGVTVDQSNFTAIKNGIASAGSLTGLAQLSVTNSQFNTAGSTSGNAILTNTSITGLEITNNLFLVNGTTPGGIALSQASVTNITGNTFWNSNGATASAVAVNIQNNSTSCAITGNTFEGFNGTGAFGMVLGASAGGCNVSGNSFHNNTVHISNSGTGNFIVNNPGYNPVGVSGAAYAPASTATYTAGASPETHYLTGGTVSAVKLPNNAGSTVCTATPCFIDLGPNESFSVTYTAAPADLKSVH